MTDKLVLVISSFIVLLSIVETSFGLDNGLARTPPMGWMSWQRFRCQIDCSLYPDDCIGEKLIRRTADRLTADGWKEAGYQYVMIDDCWQEKERDRTTDEIIADVQRFPNGIKSVGDYIHSKGLLFGIYLDYGTYTCEKYPGSMDYLKTDAQSLVNWEVDYVKMDGCYSPVEKMPAGYEEFGRYMNSSGRSIVFSCSYPAYINWQANHSAIEWKRLQSNCNLWRMLQDVQDSWQSVFSIINAYKEHGIFLAKFAGPGSWNDPDMLLLGNFGLSKDQQRVQMGMWCMFAAPLLISLDMQDVDPFSGELLKNSRLIAINQDSGGRQAVFINSINSVQLWTRRLEQKQHSWAIAFLYEVGGGFPKMLPVTLKQMGIGDPWLGANTYYTLTDVFDGSVLGKVKLDEQFIVRVNPTGLAMYLVEMEQSTSTLFKDLWLQLFGM